MSTSMKRKATGFGTGPKHFKITDGALLKIFQSYIILKVVNAFYCSGKVVTQEKKEAAALELFEAEVPRFVNKVGDYEGWTEYQKGRFDVDTFMKSTKSRDFDGHKLWDKGMAIRRGIVGWIAKYGDILKFNKSRGLDEEEPGTVGNLLLDSGVVVDDMLQRLRLNEYRDFLKVIDVDGNAEVEDEEAALDDLPETFFTLE